MRFPNRYGRLEKGNEFATVVHPSGSMNNEKDFVDRRSPKVRDRKRITSRLYKRLEDNDGRFQYDRYDTPSWPFLPPSELCVLTLVCIRRFERFGCPVAEDVDPLGAQMPLVPASQGVQRAVLLMSIRQGRWDLFEMTTAIQNARRSWAQSGDLAQQAPSPRTAAAVVVVADSSRKVPLSLIDLPVPFRPHPCPLVLNCSSPRQRPHFPWLEKPNSTNSTRGARAVEPPAGIEHPGQCAESEEEPRSGADLALPA